MKFVEKYETDISLIWVTSMMSTGLSVEQMKSMSFDDER